MEPAARAVLDLPDLASPAAGLRSGAPYWELMTSTQVVPFTVQLEFLRTSSNLRVGPSLRPITSVLGLSSDGIEFFARLVGSCVQDVELHDVLDMKS